MLRPKRERKRTLTLIAIWYRRNWKDLYAIADSQLTGRGGKLTERAPKFTIANVVCFTPDKRGRYSKVVLNRTIAIGYAGSASVAFATIATLQAYLSSLALRPRGSTPGLGEVAALAQRILEENFRDFGALWEYGAACDLIIFGFLPSDRGLKAFHVGSSVAENAILVNVTELPLVEQESCTAFGSGSEYYMSELKNDMEATGNFHPFNLLRRIIDGSERPDIGGHIHVAIANKSSAFLPHVVTAVHGYDAQVSFLGRDVSAVGPIGDCLVGVDAVGPDAAALEKIREGEN